MNERYYRLLVIASVAVGLVGALFDTLFPSLLPQSFRDAQQIHDAGFSTLHLIVAMLLGIVSAVLYVASIYGLYRFRSWAPRLSIITTVILIVVCPFTGVWVQSGVTVSFSYLASYLWGAVLVLPFTPPLKARFAQHDA